jgi:hypothetical protein
MPPDSSRCRLCTANDREALIEELAARMWESRRDPELDPHRWEKAPSYWQRAMRQFAGETIKMLIDG